MIRRERRGWRFVVGVILVTFFAFLCIVPLVYMVLVSFAETTTMYIKWDDIRLFDFFNYRYLFENREFGRPILNSLIVVVISVIAVDLISCTMAYGFEKKPIPGKKSIFNLVLATMMIPTQVVFISLYVMMRQWHLLNTYIALVIPLVGAFGVFMMRQFIRSVPNDFIEAAQIDGCSEIRIYTRIVLPMVKPARITLAIFTFNSAWNALLWPLIAATKNEMHTLTVATSSLTSYFATNYGPPMAAATLYFIVPFVLYCLMQKEFVEGIALGGVKG